MNKKLRIVVFIAIIMCSFFISCQEEDINVKNTNAVIDGTPDYVSEEQMLELLKNLDIKQSVKENSRRFTQQKADDGITTGKYFEKIDLVDYDNYSMFVSDYTTENPYYLYFIVTIDKNALEKAFYVKFTPTAMPKEAFNVKKFAGRMELRDPDGTFLGAANLNAGYSMEVTVTEECTTTTFITEITCSNGGQHGIGEPCDVGINDAHIQVSTITECHNVYSYTFVAGGGGGGGGGGSTPPSQVFKNTLTQEEIVFLTQNSAVNNSINALFENYNYLGDATFNFAKKLLVEMMAVGLKFDVNRSYTSPFNIDISSVQGATAEEVKFRQVYDKLRKSPKFKKLFTDLFGESNSMNVVFKIGNLPVDGTTQLQPSPKGFMTNQITINRNTLLSSSEIRIARIIIHECIHAFLNVKLKDPNVGMAIPDINNMDFTEAINTMYDGLIGNNAQHDFFVDHMVPVIAQILSESKQLLLTPEQIAKVDNPEDSGNYIYKPTNTTPPTNSGIPTPWIWNDFFKYMSLEGLHDADSFYTVYPVNSTEYYYFKQYNQVAAIIFAP